MRFRITRCHGSGNDFPLIDARGMAEPAIGWAVVARALADRAGPVGSDGLLLLKDGDDAHAFGFAMYNSDGSEAETCLNGLRCVARAGFEALGVERATVRLATSSATVERVAPLGPGVYTVRETAGPAGLDLDAWPMAIGRARNIDQPIAELGSDRAFTAVAMPNPHLVAFVDAIDVDELVTLGLRCEAAPAWLPRRANVSFVTVAEGALFVRTHERGVGLTNACGSAMAASVHAAALTGRIDWEAETTVRNPGGLVRATAHRDGSVSLAGNATYEWQGSVTVDADGARDLTIDRRFPDEIAAWETARKG